MRKYIEKTYLICLRHRGYCRCQHSDWEQPEPLFEHKQMENIKRYTAQFENALEAVSTPVKPWLPGIARFLLVVTFLEDSLRIW